MILNNYLKFYKLIYKILIYKIYKMKSELIWLNASWLISLISYAIVAIYTIFNGITMMSYMLLILTFLSTTAALFYSISIEDKIGTVYNYLKIIIIGFITLGVLLFGLKLLD